MVDTTQTEREVSEGSTDTTETEHTTTEQTLTVCPECDGRLEHDHKHGETACVECYCSTGDDVRRNLRCIGD
jgi:transcription initiation factor TFIIB